MQLQVTFSNVVAPRKLICAWSTGVSPQTWTLWCQPQTDPIEPLGTLFFTDGTISVTLPNCLVLRQEIEWGVNGPLLKLTGVDRRHFWTGKAISGRYNVRGADGTIIPSTEKTPQELAALLWEAMGEPGASVAALPGDERPEVDWDFVEAAPELEELCNLFGCSATLNVATNQAGIVVDGVGAALPDNLDIRWTQNAINGVLPTRIEAISGPIRIQSKFKTEPVLQDDDDSYVAADDVSYAPSGGWAGTVSDLREPMQPDNASASDADLFDKAKKLWRLWRVTAFADGSLEVPGIGTVNEIAEVLPLSDKLLAPYRDDDGEIETTAYLVGTAAPDHDPEVVEENTADGTRLEVGFSLDGEKGIVTTTVPLPKKSDDDLTWEAGDVYLVCTHKMQNPDTHQYVRQVQFITPGGPGGVVTIRRDDIIPQIVVQYGTGASHTMPTGTTSNLAAVTQALGDALARELARLTPRPSQVREYNGIQAIATDGAIRGVWWSLDCERRSDERNCTTTAYRNVEGGPVLYQRERQRQAAVQALRNERLSRKVRQRKRARRTVQ